MKPGEGAGFILKEVPESLPGAAGKPGWQFWFDFVLGMLENPIRAMATDQILPIILFAILTGLFVNRIPDPYRTTVSEVCEGFFRVMMRVVSLILWLAPLGVYAIFVLIIAQTGPEVFEGLLKYALTVLLGLMVHAFIVLPLALKLIARVSPLRHLKAMSPALLTAFSTSSSSATLPLTMRCVEDRAGVSNKTSSFVLPLGATVNMDGTALYECVAALFIAQIYASQGYPVDLSITAQITVVFTALMASIGAAGIPMAGLVMLAIILNALNLPLEGAGYVIAVDRILDMCRTTVNVWSDASGCVIIAKSEGETEVLTRWPPPEREDSLT
jgi:Na+/H+-dicarboxylate symporter